MLGFIFGTVCLIGLFKVLRRQDPWGHGYSRCGGWHGYGHGDAGIDHEYGYGYRGYVGRRRMGRRLALRSIFERLDTTPGQEKAIVVALDELQSNERALREELKETRADIARAFAGGVIDDASLEEVFARHDRLLATMRVSFVEALKAASEALDERQRKELAAILSGGSFFGGGPRWGGPYRA